MYIYKYIYIDIDIDIVAGFLVSRGCVKNVSWPSLSLLRGWSSLTMAFTGKFLYIYISSFHHATAQQL